MNANLADLLRRAAEEAPEGLALVEAEGEGRMTWRELDDAVERVAHGLGQQGLVAGNRVALVTANRLEFVVAFFAVLRAQMVAVPMNPRSTTGELVRMVADSGARLVVADAGSVTAARSVVAGIQDALVGADDELKARAVVPRIAAVDCLALPGEVAFDALLATEVGGLPAARDPQALAVLLYTSGASARPRAAMLTHRALLANIEQSAAVEPAMTRPDDVVYGVLPLFHVYGLNAVLGQVVRQHATLVVADAFDPETALDHVVRHGVTVLPVAPPVLAYWRTAPDLAARLATVRVVISGSAPLSPELIAEFSAAAGVRVEQGYGLTEAAPVVTSTMCSRAPKPGSVGAPLPGVRLRILDDGGQDAEGDDPGEILVAGDNLFDGYWPDASGGPVDGWLHTGDVGYLDSDGDLVLVDRLKELVIVSGFNVYPREVEEVIAEVEGVQEVAVVGAPDEETGERVVAYVRSRGASPEDVAALTERVLEHCSRRLARFKQPARIEVVAELPRTVTGKIAKGKLRATQRRQHLGLLE